MANASLAGHGNPNGAISGAAGALYVDVDTSNLFANMDGNVLWNCLLQIGAPSAAFTGLVSTVSTTTSTGSNPWVTISLIDLASYIEGGLLTPLNKQDLAAGQTDRFTRAMTDVVAEVRATIQSYCHGFVVSATANSVPPELKRAACCQIILAMQAACPALVVDKDKRKILEDAVSMLKDVRDGKLRPSNPPDPQASDVQGFPDAQVVSGHCPQATPWSLRGL